jgi:hypothetical protein
MSRIDKAIDLFNKGFQTKADQKRCLDLINRSYSDVRDEITSEILVLRNTNRLSEPVANFLYWLLPYDVHQFRPKHSQELKFLFEKEIQLIEYLVELRNTVKSAQIVKIASESVEQKEKVEKIEKTLKEIFEHNMNEYNRGLELSKLFKYLPITVTPHWVFRDGIQFIRYFYFMAGKLTALNTILAVMQTIEDEKEKNND